MPFESTEQFYEVKNSAIVSGPTSRPNRFGDASPDSTLAVYGWYRLWIDKGGPKPGRFYTKQIGPVVVNEVAEPPLCTREDTWVEQSAEDKRAILRGQIEVQVTNPTGRQLVEDPLMAREVESTSGGASEKKSDLEDADDNDLNAFDSTVTPTPKDGTGFIEARMTTFIDHVEPWVSEPENTLALRVAIEIIRGGDSAAGASARAHMFGPRDGPSGAVMAFTQDPSDPNVWESRTQLGRYWNDPVETASMRLLWNNGSLPVAETKLLQGLGDRHSAVVRAPI